MTFNPHAPGCVVLAFEAATGPFTATVQFNRFRDEGASLHRLVIVTLASFPSHLRIVLADGGSPDALLDAACSHGL